MMKFTGYQYLQIDIANCFGLDRRDWIDRLLWVQEHENELEDLMEGASEPLMYLKAVRAYRDVQAGKPTGHIMFLDATASGLQIMAVLSGCHQTAKHVNLVNTGKREDVYQGTATEMNHMLPVTHRVSREDIKKPLMTHYYNKQRQDTLEAVQQEAFYSVLSNSFEGAEAVKDVINDYWNYQALEHTWKLPDGHVSRVKVTEMINTRIEVDELDHTTFTYRFEANMPSDRSTSLVPNVIHSVDAYVARELVRRSSKEGFRVAHIHDAFCAHPNHMQRVRELYVEILCEIADSNLLEQILGDICGEEVTLNKYSQLLSRSIRESEYALS